MLRLLADENLNNDIVRGLIRRRPDLDIIRVQDVGLATTADEAILHWATGAGRLVVTHDASTLIGLAYARRCRAADARGDPSQPDGPDRARHRGPPPAGRSEPR